jgi:predicted metal-dependent hydrolase
MIFQTTPPTLQKEIAMEPLRPDRIIRTRRRTISLEITKDAALVVRAPLRTPDTYIKNLIEEKRAWIEKKMADIRSRPAPQERRFARGGEFLFLGKFYSLETIAGSDAGISLGDRFYVGEERLPEVCGLLKGWYVEKAAEIMPVRVAGFAAILDYRPKKIRISDTRRRWASCSTSGTLSFCWRLVLAPPEVIDYVIVHELVHMRQPDHSNLFWEKVRRAMPDYERHRDWLRKNERMLDL